MSASPIAGNQFYNGIVSELNSTRVTAGNLFGPLNGGPSEVTFIGYSPTEFYGPRYWFEHAAYDYPRHPLHRPNQTVANPSQFATNLGPD